MNRKWQLLALVVFCVASLRGSFAQPDITGLSPTSGTVSTSVAITGTNFGSTQGSSTVAFNGTTATTITNWGATSITATVPTGATSGNVVVTVGGVASNGVWFTFNDTYGNAYQYRKAIVLGHANVPNTDQTDFPVLISGVYSYLANVSNGGLVQNTNGYDIIFSQDPEGATQLDYEIDGYDPTTGTVAFWARIPTLSHTVDTVIYMFYGNANITSSQQNLAGVWRNNYLSVYHLGSGSSVGLSDSGSAGYTLSGSATAVTGKIGGGAAFNGNPGIYLYNDSLPVYPSGDSPVTLETWVQFASSGGGWEILGYGANSGNGSRDALYWDGSNAYIELENLGVEGPMPYDSNWHHLVGVYGGGALSTTTDPLYLDGVPLSTSTGGGTPAITTTEFKIGGIPTVTFCCALNGSVDEVRVSSGVRSSDWVATEYANESSPATFYAVEGQATPNSAPTIQILSPSSYPVGASIIIQGYGFQPTQGTSTVMFNGVTASPTAWNDASIVVPVPAGATTGNVVVTVGGVASNGVSFTVFPTPNITGLDPSSGVVGTSVTIAGTNFGPTQGASAVAFNGATATITSWSATSIVATAPTGTTTGNVLVTVGGVVSNGFSFTIVPSIMSVSPPSGTVGASVTITGANFGAAQGTGAVTFNGTAATTITSWGATSITARVPTGATTGNVVVTVGGIASNGVGFGVCAGVCADYGNGYQYRQTIVVGYANVPNTDQTNFPVLISGIYSYLANVSNGGLVQSPNGYDIVFCSDPEGANPLNYETESYDPATGTVNFWVSVPTLSHTANTIIYLFYGNSSVTTNQSNSTAVWDANYVGVWHLPNGTTLTANDSTSNGRNGTLSGATATSGQIDGGASFNGSSVITIPTIGSLSGPFTIEEWASPGSTGGSLGLFGSRSPSDESFDAKLTGGLVHADIGSGSGWLTTSADASFSYSVNSWHDFVYAVSDAGYQIFADGSSIGSGSFSGIPLLFDSNHILEIGGTGYGGEEFVGAIDEVRVSSTIRSADWIATEYANESSPSTFYTMEGQAMPGSAPTIQFLSPATGLIGSSVTIQGYGFQSTQGASTVSFNGVTAIPTSWNDASIIVPVPAGATNGNVIVTEGGVQSNGVSFMVLPTAGIINLSPTSGPAGTTVTITGTNFGATQSASTVTFAGTTAIPTNWSATSITVPVPNGATTGNVIVTVDGGASNAVGFTVTPSLSITGLSPSSGMVGTLVTITGTLFGATQGASTVALNTVTAVVVSWSNTNIVAVVPAGAASGPFSVTVNGQLATSSSFTVTALPTGWLDTDVGSVSQAGSATYSGGIFTTAGAGGGTWSNADGMHFVYQTLVGDGSITARLTSLQSYGPSAYAEAGVMIRETLNPGSTNALVLYSDGVPCPGSRSTTNAGENVTTGLASGSLPQWMELVRVGSALTAYISSDGINWSQLGTTMTVSMAQTLYIGMFVSGINYLEPATFDNVSINSTANPAPLITALSPTTASVGSQVAITGNNFGATQGGSLLLLNGAPITVTSWSNTGIAFTVPTGATSGLLAVSLAPSMNDSNPANLEVTTQPIPTSWMNQDVTAVDTPIGSATFSGGVFTVTGAGGVGLGGTADGMQFVYQTLTGDGSIIARLTSVQNTPYSGTDAGVMIRETLDPGSADAAVFYAGVSAYVYFQDRPTTGATANTVQGPYLGNAFPEWLELVRAGNTFTAFSSPDGVNWTQMGTSTTVTMAQTVYIGLAVSGFGTLEPATFDNISINSSANPAPVITGLSATSASVGSQVEISGNNFGATQNGSVLLLNGTSIAINLWSNTSVVFTVPMGATSGPLVVSVAPSMNDSNPVNLGISADPLPTPWLNQDVGAVGTQTGSSTFSGGTFTVTGAGGGIGGTADGMQFAYQTLVGDGSIIARLTSLQNTPNSGTDAGVMIRETLNSGATDATVFYAGATGYLYFQDRPTTGATVSTAQGSYVGTAFPEWLEAVRAGNTFTGFSSPDGVNWTQIGTSTTVTMAQTVYIGLAVSGFGTLEPATFDSVAVTVGTTPFVTGVTPVVGTIGTSVTIAGSNFGSTQGSSTVTFNGALATTITSWSNSRIVATAPNSTPNGTGPVIVTVNSIASPITTGALFTVINPIITSLEPPAGPVGGILTINGSGFGASQNGVVSINGVNAGVYFNCPAGVLEPCWSDTQIQVVIPNTTSGVVTVSNDGIVSNSAPFTVAPPPVITSLSPTTGEPATVITVDGSGFGATQSDSTVAVGGINAPVSSWSDSQIIASVPNIPMNGVVTVTVAGNTAQGPLFIYNAINQLTASNGAVTTYDSGDFGNAWRLYSSAGPGCSTCTVRGNVVNSFDNNGNLLSTTDANGNTITYTYDGNNNMLSQTAQLNGSPVTTSNTYNNLAEVLSMTDPLGNTTTNTYDANGNLLTVASPNPNSQTPPSVTQFTYNTLGELTQILDPLNHPTTISYYPTGLIQSITDAQNHTTSYTYDSRGNRTSVIDPINGSSHPTSFAYDAMSRLTGITYPDGTVASFTYDSRGRRVSATDQNGKATTYAYDAADRLISVTDPASNLTQYGYDTESDLTSITDANNHTTYFAYDTMGRVMQTTFPSTLTETYSYDQLYNLTSKTDRKGNTIQYVYDSLYRMTSKTYPDETSASYVYDLVGKIQQVTDPTGTYAFAYDNMGRLIGTNTQYTFLPGHNFQNSYSYDAASNRTSLTAPDGSINTYQYDTLNRLSSLTNSPTGQFGFGYDALSRRTQLTRPNGVNTSYSYDSVSHLLSVLHQSASTTLDGASYTYDSAGNRTSKGNYLTGITSNYTYDSLYELTQVTQAGSTTETYGYDAVGNRLNSMGVPSYSYDTSNELTSNSNGSYTYDANGSTLNDPSGKSYTWDFENRLTQAVVPGTGTVTFKYDPFGRRIYKSSPSFAGIFAYDGNNLIETVNASGTVLASYTQGPGIDQPFAEVRSGTISYYQSDVSSSITSLSNATGALANTYTYDAFGDLTGSTGTLINPFQYAGRDYDAETGLRYYRARFYDPRIGRFVSEDPARFEGGIDFYSYAANSPANFIDPFGFTPSCVMTSAGLQCTNNNPVNDQIDAVQALFPGSVQNGNSLNIPMSCDNVNQILESSGYYTGGPFTAGNWLTQNPFLFWDPIFHWGGSEWRSRSGFHFRRKYTFCNKSCTLDEFHIDSHNPMYDPWGHIQCDIPKAIGLGGCP